MSGQRALSSPVLRRSLWWARGAWFGCALSAILLVAQDVFGYLSDSSTLVGGVLYTMVMLAFATVAALIVSRRPENRIGWLVAAATFSLSLGGLALDYAVYTLLTAPHTLPGGEWLLWFGAWVRSLGFFSLILFLPLLFPNGELPSPRWRLVEWSAIGAVSLNTLVTMFAPTNETELRLPALPNPLGVSLPRAIGGPLQGISLLGLGAITLLAAASVVVRFRSAGGEERQQLKWFAYAGVMAAVIFGFILLGTFLLPDAVMVRLGGLLFTVLLSGFPISIGIAVLKYRLYDIDILIRKTLTYGLVVALLAVVYFGSVVLLQQIFATVSGQRSELITVLSTLAIAALFVPLRNRIQDVIDRRFYRKKYDAQQVLNDFAKTVRDETDLEKLTGRLMQVVDETMQPKSVSVWLKRAQNKK